jgi:transposase
MEIAVLGIDLGKNSCSLVGLDRSGAVVKRRRMRPESIPGFTKSMPSCIIAMEACCGAHHLGRLLTTQGHTVRLMSPEYVRPYVKAQKNDDRDAEAIAEAATRPTMRFVALKSEDQLDMQTLHRARDRLVGERTALINQLRAILLERGITVPKGRYKLQRHLDAMPDPDDDILLSGRTQRLVDDMRAEWLSLDQRIVAFDNEFAIHARSDVAAIGNAEAFARGRDLAAWLGLVPRQLTTGGKPRLVGITKRGNKYLRRLLIHGARSALPTLSTSATPLGGWLRSLLQRVHKNAAVVALANKLARIVWAILRRGEEFDAAAMRATA